MNHGTPGSARPLPATPDALHQETIRIEQHLQRLRRSASAGRWIMTLAVIVIVLQFAGFSYLLYQKIRGNFSQANVQQAVSARGDEVLPIASNLLMETGKNILPVYRDAMMTSLKARGPKMAAEAVAHFEQVPQQSGKVMQEKLQATFDGVIKKIEPEFKAAYPNLSDEKRQQLVQAFLADQIAQQNKHIADHITGLYSKDLVQMHGVLDKFSVPDNKKTPDSDELERNFLHTMVALLDDQLNTTSATATVSTATVAAGATTQPTH